MSYKVKPQLKLYKFENNSFVLQAIIDDYSEVSFEHNLYQAGTFTISINYNIPNSQLFQRGLFVQFGNNPGDFGEIYSIQDSISKDGKGSQTRTIVGYDARYILKRRVIKNMNSNGLWVMTAKGELCIRNLIKDQCGVDAEEKRRLPIINNIPDVSEAKGKEYSVSEQFTNLYEVCKTIATQSEIGWRISFINNELNLEIYEGEDLSQIVRFDTNYESLANGKFSDSSESFSNAIYIGGKGQNDSRDIYEGENGSPSGFNRFESWDNQSQMTTEDEYETEAISMLSQYGQTLTITGNGLVKCPYVFREQYNVGDIITVAFSGKSAAAQILSVTEHWSFGNYEINFNFGKPQNNLSDQLQLMLRQIQKASEKSNSTESVKWYNVANENTMDSADVTYNTIGFTGAMTSNKTFTFYLDDEKTGAKSYNIYAKNLTGNYNLTLTTGRSGKTNVVLKGGVNITSRILIDEEGNIISQGMTSTSVVESGNNQPVTSSGVAIALANYHKITLQASSTAFYRYILLQPTARAYDRVASFTFNIFLSRHGITNSKNIKIDFMSNYDTIERQCITQCGITYLQSSVDFAKIVKVTYNNTEYFALKVYVYDWSKTDIYYTQSIQAYPSSLLYKILTPEEVTEGETVTFTIMFQNGEKILVEADLKVTVDNTSQTTLAELLSSATAQMDAEQAYICKLRGYGTGLYTGNIMTYQKSATPNYAMALVIRYDGTTYKCKCLNGTWTTTAI